MTVKNTFSLFYQQTMQRLTEAAWHAAELNNNNFEIYVCYYVDQIVVLSFEYCAARASVRTPSYMPS